jgi:transposase-like protein
MAHRNARLTVHGRRLLIQRVESGSTVGAAAEAAGFSRQTASKWVGRYRKHGEEGLADASSRPHRIARGLPTRTARRPTARPRRSHGGIDYQPPISRVR